MRVLPRLRRPLAFIAAPLAFVSFLAWAVAGDDPASKAREALRELEARRAAPALSGASVSSATATTTPTPIGDDDGGAAVDAQPAPRTNSVAAAEVPIAEANKALKRAEALRSMGDIPRAELAEDLALEWALTARETVKAIETEREADDEATLSVTATTKAEKARAFLEEAIARRGRLQATLDDLDKELAEKPLDAGSDAKPPKKPPAKKAGNP